MLKKVLPLLSITEFDFSVYNYFESLKKPQNIVVDDVLRLLAIFNIKHLTNLLLQILNEFEPFNGEILIYGSALTHLLDSKTSSLPPNDIDILVLSNMRNLTYSTFLTQPKFLDVINYQQSYNFPFETIKVTGNPSVDINFFLRDKSEYNLKELGRVLGNNQAIYLFKENGKLKVQFKRVFEHQSDLDILNPYSRGLKFLKIRLDQHIESLSTLFDIHKFLTKNIRYYNKKYQLESVKTKYKFHIDKCLEFVNCYSDIKSVSCEDIQFDFETFKTNLVTFKSKFPRTTGLPSNLDILILLLDAYLIKFCYLIELVSSPSLHSYKSLNDSDLATEDMSISTIQSEEYFPNKFDSE
ncbi:MAG: hypothetical protein VXX85_04640, partial [Candidatus Margulisiibacteriota bacterium]|nr:hypothetical protein [Candidatus Margulisiibacteriota bacterium]